MRPPNRRHDPVGLTPPGVHLVGVGRGNGPAHGRPQSRLLGVVRGAGAVVLVFVLALLMITGTEAVVGRPLSGGDRGHTSLGDVLHPTD